jgi:hypothetical protein
VHASNAIANTVTALTFTIASLPAQRLGQPLRRAFGFGRPGPGAQSVITANRNIATNRPSSDGSAARAAGNGARCGTAIALHQRVAATASQNRTLGYNG